MCMRQTSELKKLLKKWPDKTLVGVIRGTKQAIDLSPTSNNLKTSWKQEGEYLKVFKNQMHKLVEQILRQ